MSLLDVVRSAVRVVDKVTKPLQPTVSFQRRLTPDDDGYGTRVLAGAVPLRAIVELKQRQVKTTSGILTISGLTVMFLDINKLKLATANKGVTTNDKITLADGKTTPIIAVGGFIDAGTGIPVATEAYLG